MENTVPTNIQPLHDSDDDGASLRTPPANLEAEQALLGAILANNFAFEKVSEFLLAHHFADPGHERIYEATAKLIERGQIANAIQLKNFFEREDSLTEVGGAQYLAKLQASYVTVINAADYGRTIHDLYLRRELIGLGSDVVNEAFEYDLDQDARQQIEVAEERLYNLAELGQTEGGLVPFGKAVTESVNLTESAVRRDGSVAGVPSGLKDLDQLLGGMHNSDLLILASRPSMGKTSLATNIAYNIASSLRQERDGEDNLVDMPQVVAFFSLEMSSEQLATRVISERSKVRSDAMRRGDLSSEDFDAIFEASRQLQDLPLFIDDTPGLSISQMRTRARRLKRQRGLSLIVVDYLQLMQPSGGRRMENRVTEVSDITRGLKAVAKDLNVPVLALAQLSRAVEQREDKRPQLSDLRESGSIEQDADVVMFIYRDQYYAERAQPTQRDDEAEDKFNARVEKWAKRREYSDGLAEVIVAKQRHGPIGTRTFRFHGETTTFSDYIADDHLPDHH